jgi:MerR family transcriptional regulator, light-induced transcriptional regulator
MANYSIRDLEKLSGIKAHTLRIWEKRYHLLEPKRTNTNIRYYDDSDLRKMLNVALLNRNGFKISRIAELDTEEICKKIGELADKSSAIANRIENLVISMIELNEEKFRNILSDDIKANGFEHTIIHIVYPFFEKVGVLWQTGAINPAQEHFISNLIRQKLIASIDSISVQEETSARSFLLFLPEGELHEIGLLFYYYLARKNGFKVIYLGQSVPFNDIESILKIQNCDYMITSFSSNIYETDINAYLVRLSNKFSQHKILFSSFDYKGMSRRFPANVTRIRNAAHFAEYLQSIK